MTPNNLIKTATDLIGYELLTIQDYQPGIKRLHVRKVGSDEITLAHCPDDLLRQLLNDYGFKIAEGADIMTAYKNS